MEIDILDSLQDVRHLGPLCEEAALKKAIELGPKSKEFTELTSCLSKQIKVLCNLEEHINPLTDPDDNSGFLLEVSSFLKELHCPYECLLEGPISQRLIDRKNRILLLDFLCTELQAASIISAKNQDKKKKGSLCVELESSSTATCLENLIHQLGVTVGENDDPLELFVKLHSKVNDMVLNHSHLLQPPALGHEFTGEQWEMLDELLKSMHTEFKTRREMLLTRLDVTIQSFKWGENAQGKEDRIMKSFMAHRAKLKTEPSVRMSHLLSAREDIVLLEKTSSAELVKNTKSAINRVVIDRVPDRGGRPKEQRPPVEMPGFRNRSKDGGGGGGSFRRGGKNFRGGGRGRRY